MKQNVLKLFAVGVVILALSKANAQPACSPNNPPTNSSVEEFLKPACTSWGSIDNKGPTHGSIPDNPPHPYRRFCTQSNAQTISCRTYAPALPSGGGRYFGPWYWIMPDPPPVGYKFQSAAFSLPTRDPSGKKQAAPDFCYGDDNSPMQPPDTTGKIRPGNPDTSWMGHKNGADHGYAVCYIQREFEFGPKWLYAIQGQEAGSPDVYIWPGNSDEGNKLIQIKWNSKDHDVSEPAELDVVYVKISP
jgi:hypothetical protein